MSTEESNLDPDNISPQERVLFEEFQAYTRSICVSAYAATSGELSDALRTFSSQVEAIKIATATDMARRLEEYQRVATGFESSIVTYLELLRKQLTVLQKPQNEATADVNGVVPGLTNTSELARLSQLCDNLLLYQSDNANKLCKCEAQLARILSILEAEP